MSGTESRDDLGLEAFLGSEAGGRLWFPADLLRRYQLAAAGGGVVVSAGPSGVGKTALAQGFARWRTRGRAASGFLVMGVRPDWGGTALLGAPSEAGGYRTTPFLEMLLAALREPDLPWFVVLDGLNLAHVGRLLGEFLGAMDGSRPLALHQEARCMPRAGAAREDVVLVCHDDCYKCFFADDVRAPGRLPTQMAHLVPPRVRIPRNFTVLATLQGDGGEAALPTALLDRCSLLSMDEVDLAAYFRGPGAALPRPDCREFLQRLSAAVAEDGRSFGYRAAREVLRSVDRTAVAGQDEADALDAEVEQRLVPRLERLTRGEDAARRRLEAVLGEGWRPAGAAPRPLARSLARFLALGRRRSS